MSLTKQEMQVIREAVIATGWKCEFGPLAPGSIAEGEVWTDPQGFQYMNMQREDLLMIRVESLEAQLTTERAGAAALRKALEIAKHELEEHGADYHHITLRSTFSGIVDALAADAGKPLLDELECTKLCAQSAEAGWSRAQAQLATLQAAYNELLEAATAVCALAHEAPGDTTQIYGKPEFLRVAERDLRRLAEVARKGQAKGAQPK